MDGRTLYLSSSFFLQKKGALLKRYTYDILDALGDYGGMDAALSLIIAPILANVVAKSFDYDLVTKHMRVKKRTNWRARMPQGSLS